MNPRVGLVQNEMGPSMKSTIVSIVPFEIFEEKPGLIPGTFRVAASTDGEPKCLVIGDSIHYVWIDEDRGSLKVTNPSYLVAKTVVNDYLSSQLEFGPEAQPGIFWLPGELKPQEVVEKHRDKLQVAQLYQKNWFVRLVRLADDDWEKTRSHYAISDTQRFAAKNIDPKNTKNRPWVMPAPEELMRQAVKSMLCPACMSDIPEGAAVCRYCHHVLDASRYHPQGGVVGGVDLSSVLRKQ